MPQDLFDAVTDSILAGSQIARDIESTAGTGLIAQTHSDARSDAEERIDQLLLVCSAMWQLLKEKTNLTETDLVTSIALIDAEDGVADGKLTQAPRACPKCNRIAAARQQRCMYCGIAIPIDNIFKTI